MDTITDTIREKPISYSGCEGRNTIVLIPGRAAFVIHTIAFVSLYSFMLYTYTYIYYSRRGLGTAIG